MTGFLNRLPIFLGAAAILAGLALGVAWMRAPHGVTISQSAPTTTAVLVAARPVPPGALLRQEDLAWRPLGSATAPTGAFVEGQTAKESIVGAAVVRGLTAGEVVRSEGVVRPDQRNFLAATLGPGLRAVTISVDAPQSASGLVLPGDRVDVVLVQQVAEGARRMAAETVLRNSRILAVGRSLAPQKGGVLDEAREAAGGSPRTITLEATPHDAQRLFLASRLGDLQLSLRGLGDIAEASDDFPVWASDVSDAARLRTVPLAATSTGKTNTAPREPLKSGRDEVLVLRGGSGGPL